MSIINTDLFFDAFDSTELKSKAYFVLAIYDITDNKRRQKLCKLLESYGVRVQKSAFECYLTKSEINTITKKALYIINNREDSFRIYRMNGNDIVGAYGISSITNEQLFVVI